MLHTLCFLPSIRSFPHSFISAQHNFSFIPSFFHSSAALFPLKFWPCIVNFWLRKHRKTRKTRKFAPLLGLVESHRTFSSTESKHENSRKERLARREGMWETNVNNYYNFIHKLFFLNTNWPDFILSFFHFFISAQRNFSFISSFFHSSATQFFLIFSFQRSTFATHFFSIFWKKSTTSVVSQFNFVNLQ